MRDYILLARLPIDADEVKALRERHGYSLMKARALLVNQRRREHLTALRVLLKDPDADNTKAVLHDLLVLLLEDAP